MGEGISPPLVSYFYHEITMTRVFAAYVAWM